MMVIVTELRCKGSKPQRGSQNLYGGDLFILFILTLTFSAVFGARAACSESALVSASFGYSSVKDSQWHRLWQTQRA